MRMSLFQAVQVARCDRRSLVQVQAIPTVTLVQSASQNLHQQHNLPNLRSLHPKNLHYHPGRCLHPPKSSDIRPLPPVVHPGWYLSIPNLHLRRQNHQRDREALLLQLPQVHVGRYPSLVVVAAVQVAVVVVVAAQSAQAQVVLDAQLPVSG